jgi:hypothetical protein
VPIKSAASNAVNKMVVFFMFNPIFKIASKIHKNFVALQIITPKFFLYLLLLKLICSCNPLLACI